MSRCLETVHIQEQYAKWSIISQVCGLCQPHNIFMVHIAFTVKVIPHRTATVFHLSSQSRTAADFVRCCQHGLYIFYGDSMDPDPQLYHVIL